MTVLELSTHLGASRPVRLLDVRTPGDGGMNAWIARGHDVRRVRARISLERQVRIVAGAIVAIGALGALLVSPVLAVVPLLIGSGLVFAGLTDTCAMGMLLARLPYNRGATSCDTEVIVREFLEHDAD